MVAALSLGALAVAACDSPAAPSEADAYDFALPAGGAVVYRWPEAATIRVLVAAGADPAREDLLRRALEKAARAWEDALEPGTLAVVAASRPEEADVVLRWSDAASPVDLSACPPLVTGRAATTFCRSADGRGIEPFRLAAGARPTPVRMIVTVLASEATTPARVRQLVAHELGHVLGIGRHSPDPRDLMWEGPLTTDRPSAADRATLRQLYRTPPDLLPAGHARLDSTPRNG